jgi:hypothetical protein
LSTAIDRQEQKDLIKKGQSGIATSINLILNRMAIAIIRPLKQFRRHQLLRKKDCPQNYQQSKNNQPQISQKLCQPNRQFLNSSQSAISESNLDRFEFQLAMLQKGAEELEKKIANFNIILQPLKTAAITLLVALLGWVFASKIDALVPLGYVIIFGF